jgi:hypothetical protein
MANSVKFLIIIALLAVAVGGFIYYYANFGGNAGDSSANNIQKENDQKPEDVSVPAATGKVDETIDALISETVVDEAVFVQEENDKNLLGSDSQAISNLGQSYDEKEF